MKLPAVLGLAASAVAYSPAARQLPILQDSQNERSAAVKEAFRASWNGYSEFAFPRDTLKPISESSLDDRSVSSSVPVR